VNPQLALAAYATLIVALFILSRDSDAKVSKALWIPVLWLMIGSSRNVSAWLSASAPPMEADKTVEGSALDQVILGALMLFGLVVLARRRVRLWSVIQSNPAVVLYFVYCGVSIIWSDFPGMSFRRWIKSLGDLVIVLVVLTEADRALGVRRFLSRVGFLLVPISLMLVNYFPNLGRSYSRDGTSFWTGVGTDKNALGLICLVYALPVVWFILDPQARSSTPTKSAKAVPILVHLAFLGLVVWLLLKSLSATSLSCLLCGVAVIAVVSRPKLGRKPAIVHLFGAGLIAASIGSLFASTLDLVSFAGRDTTLTGRTVIWSQVLSVDINPVFGTGYESFWAGDRMEVLRRYWSGMVLNQAHNGYIEIYLNLGWVGIFFLALVLLVGYRRVTAAVIRRDPAASLSLAYFVSTCIYNCTEASFKMMHPVWITFLLATTVVPEPVPVPAVGRDTSRAPLGGRDLPRLSPAVAQPTMNERRA
jgi:O-antigen ligase